MSFKFCLSTTGTPTILSLRKQRSDDQTTPLPPEPPVVAQGLELKCCPSASAIDHVQELLLLLQGLEQSVEDVKHSATSNKS